MSENPFNLKLSFQFNGDEIVCETNRHAQLISREVANIKDAKPPDDGGCYRVTMAEFQKVMAHLPDAEQFKRLNSHNHHVVTIGTDRPSFKAASVGSVMISIKFLTHLTERGFVWKPSKPIVISDQP